MKAAVFDAERERVEIQSLPDPRPGADELLVRICRCGVCGSDVSMTSPGAFKFQTGRFGHEYAGEVIEVGAAVRSHRVGDRIAAIPVIGCGSCEACARGNPLLCPSQASSMFGFGELAVIPPKVAIRLPSSLSFADGALIEPFACGLHAMRLARLEPGARVLILGAGSMALAAAYWARKLGAGRIVVLSRSTRRRESVLAMGADAVLGFDPDDQARVPEVLGGRPDVVADCVGKPETIPLAATLARGGGTVLGMGMCTQPVTVLPALFNFSGLHLIFPIGYTANEFEATARTFDAGRIDPAAIVSDVIPLEQLPARLDAMRRGDGGGLKVHVDLAA